MDIKKLRKILSRYGKGRSNETESALIEAWYRSYNANEQSTDQVDLERVHEAMRRNIRSATVKRSIIQLTAFRVAAALAVFSMVALLVWNFTRTTYSVVATGTKGLKELTLPDGSVVWLNAASRLKVPNKFTGDKREIFLEEGEAFFDVKKDTRHPFIVYTATLKVQVLGTSFSIKAYQRSNAVNVSVATGKVGVLKGDQLMAMLTPGQKLSYDLISNTSQVSNVDADHIKSWQQGFTYLDDANFKELAVTLKSLYGISVKAGNTTTERYRFSLRLMHDLPPAQVLELISQLHHTKVRKEGDELILY